MDEFRTKLFQIGQELTTDDLDGLKYFCEDIIPAGKAEFFTKSINLLQELERIGKLSEDNPHFLAECLARIGRIDLRDKLLVAAKSKEEEELIEKFDKMRIKQKASQFEILDGDIVEDGENRVQAHLAVITSKDQVEQVLAELKKQDPDVAKATHNIWAYRIFDTERNAYDENCDDDGDDSSGARVLRFLQRTQAADVVVVVSCWYETTAEDFGEIRFKCIQKSVLDLFLTYGIVRIPSARIKKFYEEIEYHTPFEKAKEQEIPKFDILHGETIQDRKSTFQAHLADITSREQVDQVLEELMKDRKIAKATYNMWACRVYDEKKKSYFEEGNDDGENLGGERLLHLLQRRDAKNVVIIVTRWHGGIHLGNDRFKHINKCASDLLQQRRIFETRLASTDPKAVEEGKPTAMRDTKESVNFTQLMKLTIDGGTPVLRDVFDSIIPPSSLRSTLRSPAVHSTLKNLKAKRILNTQQWDILYPASESTPVTSADFNTTMLFVLIRNICGLRPPATGWDKPPVATDLSREADLARIKYYRNYLFTHITRAAVSDNDFEKYWEGISEALVRLGGPQYESYIDRLKVERMDLEVTEDLGKAAEANIAGNPEVPPEILARGPKAEEAYQHALKEGKVQVYRGRIMLIGQHGAGKSSLKKSLLGLPFNPEEPSTVGVDVDPSSFSVDVDNVIEWKKLEDNSINSFADRVAKIMADRLIRKSQEFQNPNAPSKLVPAAKMAKLECPMPGASANRGLDDSDDVDVTELPLPQRVAATKTENRPSEDVIENVIKYLSEKKIDELSSEDKVQVSVWDFAGQQLYYASHPVFFSPRAVYILVLNLNKDLEANVEPCERQGVCHINLDTHENQTNIESILSWLVSVHSARPENNGKSKDGKELPYLRPPVIIVGTHADCPFEEPKKMEEMIQKSITGNSYDNHVVRAFIAVDNKSEDKKGVQEVRNKVLELFGKEPYIGEYIPVRWFIFEKVIKNLVDEKGINHLPLGDVEEIVFKDCNTENQDEIAAMLNFYHDLGVIVKYGNLVVLNAEWLIDLFKRLITINHYNEQNPQQRSYWKKLEDTGILDMGLVEHVFDDAIKKKARRSDIKEDILAMMERYALIAKFGTADDFQYFVPAQLQSSPGDLLDAEPKESDPCALYLQFKDGFVPHGLYYSLVSKLITWCSQKQYLKKPKLFQNVSRFAIGCSNDYELLLICRKPFIKVVLRSLGEERSSTFKPAISVLECLRNCIDTLKNDCLGYRSISYDITVRCTTCSKVETKCQKHKFVKCRDDGCLHLLPAKNDQDLFCEEAFRKVKVPGLDEWYRDPSTVVVSTFNLTENQRRWLVIGVCLNTVLLPPLRKFLEENILNHYTNLKASNHIHTQAYGGHLVDEGKCRALNYRSINNNNTIKGEKNYDYKAASAVDLGKLYLQPHMAKFTGFDNTCDLSAVLGILSSASVFSSDVQDFSRDVRGEIRNEWGHCNFQSWDETKFEDSFRLMNSLLKALKLSSDDEKKVADQLTDWEEKGVEICMANTVPPELVKNIEDKITQLSRHFKLLSRNEANVAQLSQDVEDLALHQKEVCRVLETLETVQDAVQSLKQRMGLVEERVGNVEEEVGNVKEKVGMFCGRVDGLDHRVKILEAKHLGPC